MSIVHYRNLQHPLRNFTFLNSQSVMYSINYSSKCTISSRSYLFPNCKRVSFNSRKSTVSVPSRSYLFPNDYEVAIIILGSTVSVSSRSYLFPNPLFQTPVTLYIATGVCVLKKFRHNILNIFYKQTALTTVFMRCAAKSMIRIILIYFFYSRNSAHAHL